MTPSHNIGQNRKPPTWADLLTAGRQARAAGILPEHVTFFLIASALIGVAEDRHQQLFCERFLAQYEAQCVAHGLANDEGFTANEQSSDVRLSDVQFQIACDEITAYAFREHGEIALTTLFGGHRSAFERRFEVGRLASMQTAPPHCPLTGNGAKYSKHRPSHARSAPLCRQDQARQALPVRAMEWRIGGVLHEPRPESGSGGEAAECTSGRWARQGQGEGAPTRRRAAQTTNARRRARSCGRDDRRASHRSARPEDCVLRGLTRQCSHSYHRPSSKQV
jgi:hypothetical protein